MAVEEGFLLVLQEDEFDVESLALLQVRGAFLPWLLIVGHDNPVGAE